jgi:hypothetical protein
MTEGSQDLPAAKPGCLCALWSMISCPDAEELPTYYRDDSHLRGYHHCLYSDQSIHADRLDEKVAALLQLLNLTPIWEGDVLKLLHDEHDKPDPETECKEIRRMLRLMRDNYERGLYEGEEYQYWK